MSQRTRFTFAPSVCARLVALFLFVAVMIPLHTAASERGKATGKALRFNPYEFGVWAEVTPSPAPSPAQSVVAIHTNVLPDGRVLFWGANFAGQTTAQIWHPTNNTLTNANHTGASLFCGGHAFLPDGRLLVTGGQTTLFAGIPNTTFFDFNNNSWSYNAANDMNAGRWYPSNVSLGNGELLVAAGTYCRSFSLDGSCTRWANNPLPQVWQTNGGWRNLYGANLELTTYPWMYLASNGKVFLAGPLKYTGFLNTSGTGAWEGPNPPS
ncbi:MAG TPA: hypothetical protein VGO96_10910, partial [Pyrinomonadaceae bacterium]|nr:hypothetical protein [Pyrinomonadaceae bacterium]